MLEFIASLEITFPSLFVFACLVTSTTPAVTPEAHAAGTEESFHLKYRQQDISSGGVLLRHLDTKEQALTVINIWPSDTARTLPGVEK